MSNTNLGFQRLFQQRVTQNPAGSAGEVVDWLGAVQSQEYHDAKWSLGMRMAGAADAEVERAFTAGEILRTHIMRPTWHFVTPADIRWMQELTSSRVRAMNAYQERKLGLDNALLARTNDLIARALEGGRQLTRVDLAAVLAKEGIAAEGQRLAYIVHRAELDCVICSGPRRGKQFTYMLLAERAPQAKSLPRDEALLKLTRRYYTGHGPATAQDFAWWSGLTLADVRAGIAMAGAELASEELDGRAYYASTALPPQAFLDTQAYLLPTYDEYIIGYANFNRSRTAGQDLSTSMVFNSTISYGGRFIGTWRRTFIKDSVMIEIAPFQRFNGEEEGAVDAAARRFGQFYGARVECIVKENA